MPNPGPGLFVDKRAADSARRAYGVALRSLREIPLQNRGVKGREARQELRQRLLEIARWYWANWDYDHKTTFADMKSEVRTLRQRLRRLQTAMDKLSPAAAQALNIENWGRFERGPVLPDHVAKVRDATTVLDQACTPILDRKNKKGRSVSVETACAALWNVREAITGRPFLRQWKAVVTRDRHIAAHGPREFDGRDALFVRDMLHAIDPRIAFEAIRTNLKLVAAKRRKSG